METVGQPDYEGNQVRVFESCLQVLELEFLSLLYSQCFYMETRRRLVRSDLYETLNAFQTKIFIMLFCISSNSILNAEL